MVLPILAAGGALLLRTVLPKIATTIIKIIPKTLPQAISRVSTLTAGLLGSAILLTSPKARTFVKEAPAKTFEFGKVIGEKIEEDKPLEVPSIAEGLTQAGIAGAIAAGVLAAVKGVKDRPAKEKVLDPADVLKATPIEDVGMLIEKPTVGAVEPLKKPVAAREKPLSIKNTFNPEINISFKKSRRFINQQILIK